jgi:hypothetical protein
MEEYFPPIDVQDRTWLEAQSSPRLSSEDQSLVSNGTRSSNVRSGQEARRNSSSFVHTATVLNNNAMSSLSSSRSSRK